MARCVRCHSELDVSDARRIVGRAFGKWCYNNYYSEGDVCEKCAYGEIGADYAEGAEIIKLMGTGWDDDY